jgi:hypothetical protein
MLQNNLLFVSHLDTQKGYVNFKRAKKKKKMDINERVILFLCKSLFCTVIHNAYKKYCTTHIKSI